MNGLSRLLLVHCYKPVRACTPNTLKIVTRIKAIRFANKRILSFMHLFIHFPGWHKPTRLVQTYWKYDVCRIVTEFGLNSLMSAELISGAGRYNTRNDCGSITMPMG